MALTTIARRLRGTSHASRDRGSTRTTDNPLSANVRGFHAQQGIDLPSASWTRRALDLSSSVAIAPACGTRTARKARLLLVTTDGVTVTAAITASLASQQGSAGSATSTVWITLLALPLWLMVFDRYRLYRSRHVTHRSEEFRRVFHAVAISVMATALLVYVLDQPVDRTWWLLLFAVAMPAVLLEREVARRAFAVLRRRGSCLRPVVIAGSGSEPRSLASTFEEQPELGYRVVGVFDDCTEATSGVSEGDAVDAGSKVVAEVRNLGADGVVLAATGLTFEMSNRISRALSNAGIHVELSCSLHDIDANRLSVRPVGRVPLLYLEPVRREGWRQAAKRVFDVIVGSTALLLCLPILVLAAPLIKLTSPGPLFFRQERVGRYGCRFTILKLRTMYDDAEQRLNELAFLGEALGPDLKSKQDPRITVVGRVLRRLSIDELPQLFNVVKGDMTLVGPRPALTYEPPSWSPEVYERLRVKPGMTGLWQVSGRNETTYEERHRLDLYYVDNWSMRRDVAILWKTIFVVLGSKGAY